MKNIDAIVTTELVNNIDDIKEENTMKKLSVALVFDGEAYTKEYDEHTALGIYKTLTSAGSVAILSDENGFFKTNCAELPEYKRVYGPFADLMLGSYEKAFAYKAEVLRWLHLDARRKMKEKYSIHSISLFGTCRSFSETFGFPWDLDPNRIAIIPDKYIAVQSSEINVFEGVGTIRNGISNGLAFTLDNFLIDDATVFPSDFDAVCEKLGANKLIDVWGNERNIKDLDLILTASCCGDVSYYAGWDECLERFNEDAKFYVYNVERYLPHTPMSYLKNLTLLGDVIDSKIFADKAKNVFEDYKKQKKAIKLLPAAIKHIIRFYPDLLSHWFVDDVLQDCYTSLRAKVFDCQMPDIGYTSFNAPDMVAFWQHALGLKVEGILHAGQCLCTQAKGRAMDVTYHNHTENSTRLPGANYAHTLFFNAKDKLEGYEAFFKGSTVYLNMYDLTTLLQYKFSGYHLIFWSQDRDLINLVRKSNGHFGRRPRNLDSYEFRDLYTYFVKKSLPNKIEVEGVEDMSFNVNVLMNDPLCEVIHGLLGSGHYNRNTGKFEGEGLFASIAFRFAKNRENVEDSDNKESLVETLNNASYAKAYLELEKFAAQNGYTMFDVCDNVTRWLFCCANFQNKTWLAKALYDLYFGVFGDMVARIVEDRWRSMQ